MSAILRNISITLLKKQGRKITERRTLIKALNCTIQKASVLTLMGKSGSGKSTLLRFITGIIDRNVFEFSGEVIIDGRQVEKLPTEERKIGMLSQEGLLFPHMTVAQNLLYAVPHRLRREERTELVNRVLSDVQLDSSFATVYPHTLSGGQHARLSLMRTIVSEPRMLLLDEPFSKLDISLRKTMRKWVWKKIEESGIPTLLVSHDRSDIHCSDFMYTIGSQ